MPLHPPEWLKLKILRIPSIDRNMEQLKPFCSASGSAKWSRHFRKQEVLIKLSIDLLYDPANPLLGIFPRKKVHTKTCMKLRHLLLGRKTLTNLDSILKSEDITLLTKVCLVKAMVFPIVIYGHESWPIKKTEHQRIDAFELWCWRRLLRVPWTARRSNQAILKEINPECSLEGLMLKLKLQYFGHLIRRADSLQKTLMLGEIEGRKRRGKQDEMVGWHQLLNGHESEQTPGGNEGQGSLACWCSWGCKESDTTERLNNSTKKQFTEKT